MTLDAASADPAGFVRGLDRAIVDEIQRAPAVLPAIKQAADRDRRPRRFILTTDAIILRDIASIEKLEQLFLLQRLVKTPKLHFNDAGLLAAISGLTAPALAANRTHFGPLLETFAFGELRKLVSWQDQRMQLSHYRDKDQDEVDFVLENAAGQAIGTRSRRPRRCHACGRYPDQPRVNSSTALVPPNANELLMAADSPGASAPVAGTRWTRHSGSACAQWALGGNWACCKASTVITASSAPAAPSRWPCKALVELTARPSSASPNTWASASHSTTSPMRVAVPWALQ